MDKNSFMDWLKEDLSRDKSFFTLNIDWIKEKLPKQAGRLNPIKMPSVAQ